MAHVVRHWHTFLVFFVITCALLVAPAAVTGGWAAVRLHGAKTSWLQTACITATLNDFPLNSWAMEQCRLAPWGQAELIQFLAGAPRTSGLNRHIYYSSLAGALIAGIIAFFLAHHVAAIREIQLRGRRLQTCVRKAAAEIRAEPGGEGIRVHPKIPLSRERETRGILLAGSPGSGKTVILSHLAEQVLARGDRALIHDVKGDFASRFLNDTRVALLAPWDARSWHWAAVDDIQTVSDARAFAERAIASSADPIWANAARQVLVGLLMHLITNNPQAWKFADLIELVSASYAQLRDAALDGNPAASQLLPPEPNKTTQSFLSNLVSDLAPIADLAASESGEKKTISLRRWMLNPQPDDPQFILLGNSQRYEKLGRAFVQLLVDVVRQVAVGPELADDKNRRIWILLDEAPQLGKIEGLSSLIETGRSRGICTVVGLQDIAQWRHVYSRDEADALGAMLGTHIYCRVSPGETANWLSEAVGQREVLKPTVSTNNFDSTDEKTSLQMHRIVEPTIHASEFGELGVEKEKGVRAFFLPGGRNVYRLLWPFPPDSVNPALAYVPADWTKPLFATQLRVAPSDMAGGPQNKPDQDDVDRDDDDFLDDILGPDDHR